MSGYSEAEFELPTFERQMETLQPNCALGGLDFIYNEYSMFDVDIPTSTTSTHTSLKKISRKRSRHTPHSEQPVDKVEKRNARERRRMHGVNDGFKRLASLLPLKRKNKRVSKENTLKMATVYIRELRRMIREHDAKVEAGHLLPRPSDGSAAAASCQLQYQQAAGQCWSNNTSNFTWSPSESCSVVSQIAKDMHLHPILGHHPKPIKAEKRNSALICSNFDVTLSNNGLATQPTHAFITEPHNEHWGSLSNHCMDYTRDILDSHYYTNLS